MNAETQVLISILAGIDALHLPHRKKHGRGGLYRHRQEYRAEGWQFSPNSTGLAADDAGRKRVESALRRLVADGLARIRRHRDRKRVLVRLTDTGDETGRAAVGLPRLVEAIDLLDRMRRLPGGFERDGLIWHRETTIGPIDDTDPEAGIAAAELEERCLPLLVRGLAVSNTDTAGRCWYAVTAAGEAFDMQPPKLKAPKWDPEACEFYGAARKGEEQRLSAPTDRPGMELGMIPMPVGVDDSE